MSHLRVGNDNAFIFKVFVDVLVWTIDWVGDQTVKDVGCKTEQKRQLFHILDFYKGYWLADIKGMKNKLGPILPTGSNWLAPILPTGSNKLAPILPRGSNKRERES